MKRIFLITILLSFLGYGVSSAKSVDYSQYSNLWDSANQAYSNGNYTEAVMLYDSILNVSGGESAKIYYNLGNAFFKNNELGKAILNYNRALKLAPYDEDIIYNLEIANANTKNKIEEVPPFFIETWVNMLRNKLNSNGWAYISVMFFVVILSGIMIYLLSRTVFMRKTGFTIGVISLFLFVISLSFSIKSKNEKMNNNEAIVMSNASIVKSSPDNNGKDIFILNEGVKVTVLESLGDWSEIVIASGNKGWIKNKSIEMID